MKGWLLTTLISWPCVEEYVAKLLKRMQAKVSEKKKKERLKHAQNVVNTVDQKGKPLLFNFILIEQIYREKKESLLQGGMY